MTIRSLSRVRARVDKLTGAFVRGGCRAFVRGGCPACREDDAQTRYQWVRDVQAGGVGAGAGRGRASVKDHLRPLRSHLCAQRRDGRLRQFGCSSATSVTRWNRSTFAPSPEHLRVADPRKCVFVGGESGHKHQ